MGLDVKRTDLALLFLGCVGLAAAIIFAIAVFDSDPPTSGSVSECRSEVSGRYDRYFALVAAAELNGGTYPEWLEVTDPPPLPVAQQRFGVATVDRLNISTVCPD